MTATCFLLINSLEKEIQRRLPDKAAAVAWLLRMTDNPAFLFGYTEDQSVGFLVCRGGE